MKFVVKTAVIKDLKSNENMRTLSKPSVECAFSSFTVAKTPSFFI